MIKKKYNDLTLGIIILSSGIIFYILTGAVPTKELTGAIVNASTVPNILAWMLIFIGVLQTGMGIRFLKLVDKEIIEPQEVQEEIAVEKPSYSTVIKTMITTIVYTLFMPKIGFLIMTVLCLFAMFIILTPVDKKKNYRLYVIISVISSCVIYYLFRNGLHLMLPEGLLK